MHTRSMTDVVVLHGAWHQPAHYSALVDRLEAAGLDVVAPDLTGLSLVESSATVSRIVGSDRPVVVGHSSGGITAATIAGARAYVFLHAWILERHESPQQLLGAISDEEQRGLAATSTDAGLVLDPDDAARRLFADASEADARRALELLRPEPPAIFDLQPEEVHWREAPSIYIAGRRELTMPQSLVDTFAARCDTSRIWPTGHSSYLTHPDDVARLIAHAREHPDQLW